MDSRSRLSFRDASASCSAVTSRDTHKIAVVRPPSSITGVSMLSQCCAVWPGNSLRPGKRANIPSRARASAAAPSSLTSSGSNGNQAMPKAESSGTPNARQPALFICTNVPSQAISLMQSTVTLSIAACIADRLSRSSVRRFSASMSVPTHIQRRLPAESFSNGCKLNTNQRPSPLASCSSHSNSVRFPVLVAD